MEYNWGLFLHCLVLLTEAVFLCFLPFRETMKGSKIKTLAIAMIACTVFSFSAGLNNGYLSNIISPIFLILAFLFLNKRTIQRKSVSLFIILITASFLFFISNLVEAAAIVFNLSKNSILIRMGMSIIFLPVIYFFMRKFISRVLLNPNILYWKVLCLIPSMYLLIAIRMSLPTNMLPINSLFLSLVFLILSITTYSLILTLLKKTSDSITNSERVKEAENLLTLQTKEYAELSKQLKNARQSFHDQHHQYAVLQNLLNQNDVTNALGYLENLNGAIPNLNENIYCNNFSINAIINHYVSIAESKNILCKLQLFFPDSLKNIAEIDLCVLVGNMIENAIEACLLTDDDKRFLEMKAKMINNSHLVIVLQNSFNGELKKTKDGYYSKKRTNELGIGLKSIEAVCKKYNGYSSFEADGGDFFSSVTLKMS